MQVLQRSPRQGARAQQRESVPVGHRMAPKAPRVAVEVADEGERCDSSAAVCSRWSVVEVGSKQSAHAVRAPPTTEPAPLHKPSMHRIMHHVSPAVGVTMPAVLHLRSTLHRNPPLKIGQVRPNRYSSPPWWAPPRLQNFGAHLDRAAQAPGPGTSLYTFCYISLYCRSTGNHQPSKSRLQNRFSTLQLHTAVCSPGEFACAGHAQHS